jgi:hypothetical protein
MPELSPKAKRIADARKAAMLELKSIDGQDRELTNHDVRRLASARLFSENIELRVVAGEAVTSAEVRSAAAMIEEARGAVPRPMHMSVKFVEGVVGKFVCEHCHKENRVQNYVAPPKTDSPNAVAQPSVPARTLGIADAVVGACSAANHARMHGPATVVPLTAADRRQQALDAAPLKKHQQEDWHR